MDSLKYYLREVGLFLTSRIFLVNFAKMVALVVGLAFLTNWALQCHTRHGESVQLPDFTGMHVSDAKRQSRDKGFRFEIIDSVWQEGKPGGIITKQTPTPLSRVKEGRKIYVTVTTWNAVMVSLPLLVESQYDYDRYAAKLAKRSVKSKIRERVFDRRQAENSILYLYYNDEKLDDTDIKNGFEVPMGATLEFVVTERLSNELQVPDLVCMNFSAAEFLVTTSNLNLGEVVADESVTDRNTAFIWKQEPAADSAAIIQMGAQISVWLTQKLPTGCGDTDDVPEEEDNQ